MKGEKDLTHVFQEGTQVWVPVFEVVNSLTGDINSRKTTHWKRARVEEVNNDGSGDLSLAVKTDEGQLLQVSAKDCCLQNERDDTVDDLVKSDFLHEPGILQTLRVRYGMDAIYTYSGSILIATNPHKRLKHLYGNRMMGQYRNVPLGELSPHTYAIAEAAYAAMMMDEQRQAILISGESGAGKTESAKMVMQYLAHRADKLQQAGGLARSGNSDVAALMVNGEAAAPIEEQVLESNPLLEAFGNAKTARNDNSSRFGKFVEIDFDPAGRITGACISTYLLERSRVVSVRSPERSFHIFYQLCEGATAEQKTTLKLEKGAQSFRFLNQSDVFYLDDIDDGEQFSHTLDAMRIIGLTEEDTDVVLKIVAAVLHLGNITFESSNRDEAVIETEDAQQALNNAAELLGTTPDALKTALTTRAIETRGERIVKYLDPTAASESRDALAKGLYSKLFDWIVAAVNRKIGSFGGGGRTARSIGILDIYGFESFDSNSFEQLCINLANEKLQQAFNAHVFKGEQAEYAAEGIAWSYIDFVDNQDCLDLLEGGGASGLPTGVGIFPLIDEACRLPRATHQDLAHALRTRLASHKRFGAPRREQHAFVVDHYAGEVCYATAALLDKNRDFVVAEHAQLMKNSSLKFLQVLIEAEEQGADRPISPDGALSPRRAQQRRSAFMLSSVGARFRKQLQGLMSTLGECQPHFIRCVKPNPASQPGSLDPSYVLEQLRAGGVLEAVRIACAGFPTRKAYMPFAQRYAILLGDKKVNEMGLPVTEPGFIDWYSISDEQITDMVKRVLYNAGLDGWQVGKTRVFLRSGQLAHLEGARTRILSAAALRIQAAWRGHLARSELEKSKQAAALIQATWKGVLARRHYQQVRKDAAAVKVQSAWKMYTARTAFLRNRTEKRVTLIQAHVRGYLARSKFRRETELGRRAAAKAAMDAEQYAAATTIQAHWRGKQARQRVSTLAAERAEREHQRAERAALIAERDELLNKLRDAEQSVLSTKGHTASIESLLAAANAEIEALKSAKAADVEAFQTAQSQAVDTLRAEVEAAKHAKEQADARAAQLEKSLAEAKTGILTLEASLENKDGNIQAMQGQLKEMEERMASQAKSAEQALEATQAELQAAISAASAASAADVEALQSKLKTAETALNDQAKAAKHAQEKANLQVAQNEALAARVARLEAEARTAVTRENALLAELEAAKRAVAVRSPTAHAAAVRSPLGASNQLRRTITQELEAAAAPGSAQASGGGVVPGDELSDRSVKQITVLISAAIVPRLPPVEVKAGGVDGLPGSAAVLVPQAAWLLHRCFLQWAREWQQVEVLAAFKRVSSEIVKVADDDGLSGCGYWLKTSLAAGALIKVQTVGRAELSVLLRVGDGFIGLTDLHLRLGQSVADTLPVNVGLLLSEDAKRSARRRSTLSPGGTTVGITSPADAELAKMGGAETHWRKLLGGITNVVDALKKEGVPAPAVRAVVFATLRYVDGELFNALLLRRECCSISGAKALVNGLAAVQAWANSMDAQWCCSADEAAKAMERVMQAARYLVQGKEDCVRKANRAVDILPDLGRYCPALTLQQVHRLTEYQHDDWIGGSGTSSLALLETLRRLMGEQRLRMAAAAAAAAASSNPTGTPGGAENMTPGSIHDGAITTPETKDSDLLDDDDEDDEENLLVDSMAGFELFRSGHVHTRRLLTDAARTFVQVSASSKGSVTPPPNVIRVSGSGPRLPDGSLPSAAGAGRTVAAGLSFLDTIDDTLRRVQLPEAFSNARGSFDFLQTSQN